MLTNNLFFIKEGLKGILVDTWAWIKNLFMNKEKKLVDALCAENAKLKSELQQLQKRLGM